MQEDLPQGNTKNALEQQTETGQKFTEKQPWLLRRDKESTRLAKDLLKYVKSDECKGNRCATEIDFRTRVFLDVQHELHERFCAVVKRVFRATFPDVQEDELFVAGDDPHELVKSVNPETLSGVHVLERFNSKRVDEFARASGMADSSSLKSSNFHTDNAGGLKTVWSVVFYLDETMMASMPVQLRAPVADLFAELIQAEEGVVTNDTLTQVAHGFNLKVKECIIESHILPILFSFSEFRLKVILHQIRSRW